jgi:hypothetical protein
LLEITGASSTRPYAPCANLFIVTNYHGKALVPQRQRSFYQLLDRAVDVRKLVRMQVVNTQVCGQLLIILGLVARWDVMTYVMFFIKILGFFENEVAFARPRPYRIINADTLFSEHPALAIDQGIHGRMHQILYHVTGVWVPVE